MICREKFKQGLKRLFKILLGQCDNALKLKLHKRSNFTTLEEGGIILKLINIIKEEG